MSNQINDTIQNEISEKNEEYSTTRFKKTDILIFVACLLLAFICWCYAHYIDDPILEKTVTVNFVLDGGNGTEYLSVQSQRMVVYGIKSDIDDIKIITIHVDRSLFGEYNTETEINIDQSDLYHFSSNTIKLKLLSNSTVDENE